MNAMKRILAISLCMIFLISMISTVEPSLWWKISPPVFNAGGATINVDDGGGKDHTTIQAAINAAINGDTVIVFPGLYNEELVIEGKTIILVGEDMDTTIINGTGSGICLDIRTSGNNISSFSIQNGSIGILVNGTDDNHIMDCNCTLNGFAGIALNDSANNTLENNLCNSNEYGMKINDSHYNTIQNNSCNSNDLSGIHMEYSNWNTLFNNTAKQNAKRDPAAGVTFRMSNNNTLERSTLTGNGKEHLLQGDGFLGFTSSDNNIVQNNMSDNWRFGIRIETGSLRNKVTHNAVISNTRGTGILFIDNCDFNDIDNNTSRDNYQGLFLQECSNNMVENNSCIASVVDPNGGATFGLIIYLNSDFNIIKNNEGKLNPNSGIVIGDSSNNLVCNNNFTYNSYGGMEMWRDCDNNKINDNLIINNSGIGIRIADVTAQNNLIHHNIIIRNNGTGGIQGHDEGANNVWDDGSGEGNFWSDYRNRRYNASHDGHIWNMSYEMDGNGGGEDRYPLASLPVPELDHEGPVFLEDNTSSMPTTGDMFNFSLNISDDVGFRKVRVYYQYNDVEILYFLPMKYYGDDNWYRNIIVRSDSTGFKYYFEIEDYIPNSDTTGEKDLAVVDNDPPEVMDLSPENATTGETYTFTANLTDNIDVVLFVVNYTFDGSTFHNVSMIHDAGDTNTRTITVDAGATYMDYFYHFGDGSDNFNDSEIKRANVLDNDSPSLLYDNTAPFATTGDEFSFDVNITDNILVSSVMVNYSCDGVQNGSEDLTPVAGENWNTTIVIPENATTMDYYFVFQDSSGNSVTAPAQNIEVLDNDDPVLQADDSPETGTTGDDFTFSVNVSDNVGIARVKVNYTYDGTVFHNISIPNIVRNGELMKYRGVVQLSADAILMEYFFYLEDTSGNVHTSSHETIYISDNDPPLVDAGKDISVDQHARVIFDGSGCSDNIDIDEYIWSFTYDDKYYELDGEEAEFTFDEAGEYNVTLNVTDGSGNWHNDTLTLTVNDTTPPTAEAGDLFAELGGEIMFDGSRSTDNVGIVEYIWNFTENGSSVIVTGRKVNYTFKTVGRFDVTLTVKDAVGNIGTDSIEVVIFVDDLSPPLADAGMDRVVEKGTEVLFDGTGSTDDLGIFNYTWSFFYDGKSIELYGPGPQFLFNISGNYTIELLVTDGGDNTDSDEIYVLVESEGTEDDDDDTGEDDDDNDDDDDDTGGGDKDKKGMGMIWYLIVAGFFGALLLVAIVLVVVRRKKRTEPEETADGDEPQIPSEGEPEGTEIPAEGTEPEVTTASLPPMEVAPGLVSGADAALLSLPQATGVEGEIEAGETPTCTGCGQASIYYPEYECFWCDGCQSYVYPAGDGESEIEAGASPEDGQAGEEEEPAGLSESAGAGEHKPELLPASTAEAPATGEEVDLTLIPTDGMSNGKKAVIEEFNQTRIILERAPPYIDITGPREILARAKQEIEGDDLEKAGISITESKDSVMAIRERYLKLVETSDVIVKSYQELQAKNVDISHIEALFATGKESMESGDFTLCEQNFGSVLQEIEKAKEGGTVTAGDNETADVRADAGAGKTPTVEDAVQVTADEAREEGTAEIAEKGQADEAEVSPKTDEVTEEPESTVETQPKEEEAPEESQAAESETEETEKEESAKPTPDDLDDMLDDLLEGL